MMAATQNSFYTVVDGDRLYKLSRDAYGDQWLWKRILGANSQLNGRNLASDGSPLIYPGDKLWIPLYDTLTTDELFVSVQKEIFVLLINGTAVPVTSAEFLTTIDTGTDHCSATIETESLPESVKNNLKPFRYPVAQVYIHGKLILTGKVYTVSPSLTEKGSIKKIDIYSHSADIIDSCVQPPYTQNSITLKSRALSLCAPFGLPPVFESGDGGRFDRITATKSEKIFDHLLKLARKKKLLVSCNEYGALYIFRPGSTTEPIETLNESDLGPVLSWEGSFNGRDRYSHYRVAGKSVKKVAPVSTVVDPSVPCYRLHCNSDSSADSGNVEESADWQRSKALADALSVTLPLDSWKTKSGEIWKPNRFVTVISKTLDIPNGVTLLIRRVTLKLDSDKLTATIDLCPKEVYTGDPVPDIWA